MVEVGLSQGYAVCGVAGVRCTIFLVPSTNDKALSMGVNILAVAFDCISILYCASCGTGLVTSNNKVYNNYIDGIDVWVRNSLVFAKYP
jgi:hypothetical protein